jgi:hypothetical protein
MKYTDNKNNGSSAENKNPMAKLHSPTSPMTLIFGKPKAQAKIKWTLWLICKTAKERGFFPFFLSLPSVPSSERIW